MKYRPFSWSLLDAVLLRQRPAPARDQLYGVGTSYSRWQSACVDELVKLGYSNEQAQKEIAADEDAKEMFSRGVSPKRVAQDIDFILTTPTDLDS
jgi:hypothetical protein